MEEERVRALLLEVAGDLHVSFYEWSLTSGFHGHLGAEVEGTADPLAAPRLIESIDNGEAICLLEDLAPHLTTPAVARALRELARKKTRSTCRSAERRGALQRKQPLTTEGVIEAANATVPLSISRREDVERVRGVGVRFTPVR